MKNIIQSLTWVRTRWFKPKSNNKVTFTIMTAPSPQEEKISVFYKELDIIIDEYEKNSLSMANQGLDDGAVNIPTSDSKVPCRSELTFDQLHDSIKRTIEKKYTYKYTLLENENIKTIEEIEILNEEGIEKYLERYAQEKKAELEKSQWIMPYYSFLGLMAYFEQERASDHSNSLKNKLEHLNEQHRNAKKTYLKYFRDVYNRVEPMPRKIIDDHYYWWAFVALFGVEILISFKSIQFFGQIGNTPSLLLALILASIAAKLVHDCGANLYQLITNNTNKGKFYITLFLTLAICIILSGFRMNMGGGSFVLLGINLLFTSIAGYLSYLRAEHSIYFSSLKNKENLGQEILKVRDEKERIENEQDKIKTEIIERYETKAKANLDADKKTLKEKISQLKWKVKELEARELADLSQIYEIKQCSYELYKNYNRDSRAGIHPDVQRWETP